MNGRSRQSNCDHVRYLDRFINTPFSGDRRDLREVSFTYERGLFAEAVTPATNSGKRLHTVE